MRTITDYIDMAQKRLMAKSRRDIGTKLGISAKQTLFHWEKKAVLPTDANMRVLAKGAGVPEEEALLDLARWRAEAKDDPESAKIWAEIQTLIKASAAAIVILLGHSVSEPEQAVAAEVGPESTRPVYIMGNWIEDTE